MAVLNFKKRVLSLAGARRRREDTLPLSMAGLHGGAVMVQSLGAYLTSEALLDG